ncbi:MULTISPECIES: chromate efflux transporter [Shewanella]|jgi:chromate transporter|uniref:Chromate transporter n=1 Tax=Shewanella chilikensis TaxID=558541 RepID=A0ABX5PSR8_9GAMM|nr:MULTISPECIES: chromate efflux transporter [Shewanella]EKT4487272.1 chromate efflux transporter [Shewanella algae]MBO2549221.1 chromate efflux transporter [Shewanella algae]MBZ4678129.1 chorismate-binding protein [Shewanella sp.]MCA0948996.1 chromate efflux transporter [Shewanella chilikensis]MCE9853567.1 chromate efflux transporter [Shewanella chilikensis]
MWQIFVRFFSLGLVSFGGPAAHIGYFRKTFVEELGWLDDKDYASLVALSQFLPGPGSSQVGFAIGYRRGALPGAILAFIGFTLPSFLLMFLLAVSSYQYLSSDLFQGVIAGLKLLAVVVVADAAWGMFKQFCRNRTTQVLALLSTVILLLWPGNLTQLLLLFAGAIVGFFWLNRDAPAPAKPGSMQLNWSALLIFLFLLLLTGPLLAHPLAELFKQFYQTGSMVFGGGHVVLPLLESQLANSIDHDRFLTGYALAQAVPGPMFSLAAYLGAELWPQNALVGALVATLAIFLPGFLLLLAVIRGWQGIAERPKMAAMVMGINATVVGLLVSALYQPVFTSAVTRPIDIAMVLTGFMLLKLWRLPLVFLVFGFAAMGAVLTLSM